MYIYDTRRELIERNDRFCIFHFKKYLSIPFLCFLPFFLSLPSTHGSLFERIISIHLASTEQLPVKQTLVHRCRSIGEHEWRTNLSPFVDSLFPIVIRRFDLSRVLLIDRYERNFFSLSLEVICLPPFPLDTNKSTTVLYIIFIPILSRFTFV